MQECYQEGKYKVMRRTREKPKWTEKSWNSNGWEIGGAEGLEVSGSLERLTITMENALHNKHTYIG